MSFLPDGRLVVAAEMDGKVVMRDAEMLAEIPSIPDARADPSPSSWLASSSETTSPDGRRIATARGREIKILDTSTGREVLSIKGGASFVAFNDDGRMLAAVSGDGTIRVWDGREATAPLTALREARSLVRWLAPRCRDRAELLAQDPGRRGPDRDGPTGSLSTSRNAVPSRHSNRPRAGPATRPVSPDTLRPVGGQQKERGLAMHAHFIRSHRAIVTGGAMIMGFLGVGAWPGWSQDARVAPGSSRIEVPLDPNQNIRDMNDANFRLPAREAVPPGRDGQ